MESRPYFLVKQLVRVLVLQTLVLTVSATCESTFPPVIRCCPIEFRELCCSFIPSCAPLPRRRLHLPRPPCSGPTDIDCHPGFVSYRNGTVIPTPGGFISPAGKRCAIPCVSGTYCPQTVVDRPNNSSELQCVAGTSRCCRYADGEVANVRAIIVEGKLVCAGVSMFTECPNSFYCPDATLKIPCANSALCPKGSIEPLKCNLFHVCVGSEQSISKWIAILVLIVILLVILLLYAGHFHRRTIKRLVYELCKLTGRDLFASNAVTSGLTNLTMDCFAGDRQVMKKIDLVIDVAFSAVHFQLDGHRILKDVFGSFKHGQLSAIMGPSGCGKTTLLNILRGKLRKNVEGDVTFNGIPVDKLGNYSSVVGFASQDDVMHSWLTVKEILLYKANIHSSYKSPKVLKEYMSKLMSLLGLSAIADDVIGGEEERGISGGQRRRLNVAMELVANPTILFCDEPTSGLDSSTSLELIRMLRNIAEETGINIICVVHQPRNECFSLFHKLLLLSSNGKVIYEGACEHAQSYFELLGYDADQVTNPADFVIDVANGTAVSAMCNSSELPNIWTEKCGYLTELDKSPPKIQCIMGKRFKHDAKVTSTTTLVPGQNETPPATTKNKQFKIPAKPSWWKQLFWMFKRELVLQIRTVRLLLVEVMITILIGGILGGMYTKPDIRNQIGKLAMASLCAGMIITISSLKYFGNNWDILLREADSGANRFSYFLAINLLSLPVAVVVHPLSFLSLYHTISDTRTTFTEHYVNLLCAMFTASGIGQLISCAISERKMHIIAVGVVLISTFVGGSNVSLCDMNKITFIGPAFHSLSFSRWFIEAQYESEAGYYSDALLGSVYYYATRNLYTLENRTLCLMALLVLGVGTRVIAFIAILCRTR